MILVTWYFPGLGTATAYLDDVMMAQCQNWSQSYAAVPTAQFSKDPPKGTRRSVPTNFS